MYQFYLLIFILSVNFSYAATFIVDNNGDIDNNAGYIVADGSNTLRKCIRLANANPGADIINFNISGSTLITNTIGGGGAWFSITDPLTIDGYSQTGASAGNPVIELNGGSLGKWYTLELINGSSNSAIKGLIIYGSNIGIRMDPNTGNNSVSGCFIGTDNTGNAAAANPVTEHGIRVEGSSNNLIGGSGGLIDRNVIASCLQEGIRFEAPASSNNTVNGNFIGIGADGITKIGNRNGILVDQVSNGVIGGGNANEGNIISGNNERGIFFINCDNFIIKGNIIGLASDLSTIVNNTFPGIEMIAGSDFGQIGGSGPEERNYISGNTSNGLLFNDCNNITIQGNFIGVAGDGVTGRPNIGNGILGINCEFMTIGGSTKGKGNVISANTAHGISIFGLDSRNTTIQGNKIGVSLNGLTALGNGAIGIELSENENSQIGGLNAASRNIISNNSAMGIFLMASPGTVVEGNYIGVDGSGNTDMGNLQHGISVTNSANIRIGGSSWGCRNIISGNNLNAVELAGTSSGAIIKGNFMGVGADGSTLIKNDENGVRSIQDAHSMTVGGPLLVERNVLSGNGQFVVDTDPDNGFVGDGVRILGTDNHIIQNNYIGTDSTGTIGIGNHWAGVSINDISLNNQILDNLISDNRNEGIWIYNNSSNNLILRNIIGEDINGVPMGNWDYGIVMDVNGTNGNIIGGSLANANIIANTRGERPGLNGHGITIASGAGNNNEITFNDIHCNAGMGILRQGISNANQAAPVVTASNANDISGTGNNGRIIHIYRNITADGGVDCDCEGELFIGSTSVTGGTWSFTHNLGLNAAEASAVTATQTTTGGSTSEFSNCIPPILLPTELIHFEGYKSNSIVYMNWITATENNSDHFSIEKSYDAIIWKKMGELLAAGQSTTQVSYHFTDNYIDNNKKGYYYRLKLFDDDGSFDISKIIFVENGNAASNQIRIFPNPSTDEINITGLNIKNETDYSIYNITGIKISQTLVISKLNDHLMNLNISSLPAGIYYLVINSGEQKKLFIKQ